jgi:hypothetical protein
MMQMSNSRLTKQIFLYDQHISKCNPNSPTWSNEITQILVRNNLFFATNSVNPKTAVQMLHDSLLEKDIAVFRKECIKLPKLRTYNALFSPFYNYTSTTHYTRLCLPFIIRKRLAQLRIGVLPIRVETDRYQRIKTPADQRYCIQTKCKNKILCNPNQLEVEDERHYLINCHQYTDLRNVLFKKVTEQFPHFSTTCDYEKFNILLNSSNIAKTVGQFIVNAFDERPIK